jgi:hypothetical protein
MAWAGEELDGGPMAKQPFTNPLDLLYANGAIIPLPEMGHVFAKDTTVWLMAFRSVFGRLQRQETPSGISSWLCLERRMVRQQLQCRLGISPLKGVDTYRANRKPNRASGRSIFCPPLNLVNPISADRLALNKDGAFQIMPSVSGGEEKVIYQSITEAGYTG